MPYICKAKVYQMFIGYNPWEISPCDNISIVQRSFKISVFR